MTHFEAGCIFTIFILLQWINCWSNGKNLLDQTQIGMLLSDRLIGQNSIAFDSKEKKLVINCNQVSSKHHKNASKLVQIFNATGQRHSAGQLHLRFWRLWLVELRRRSGAQAETHGPEVGQGLHQDLHPVDEPAHSDHWTFHGWVK